ALASANADHLVDAGDEDFSVSDAPRMGRLLDRLDGALHHLVLQHDLDLYLGQEVDDVLGAAVELGMALLPAEALGLGDGDAFDAGLVEGIFHLVELERFDDGLDFFHDATQAVFCRSFSKSYANKKRAGG